MSLPISAIPPAAISAITAPASSPELASALSDLLKRYVLLLDTSWHGGWDAGDEAAVRRARAALVRADFAALFPDEIARHLDLSLASRNP